MTPTLAPPVARRDRPPARASRLSSAILRELPALCDRQLRRTMRSPGKFIGIAMNPVVFIIVIGVFFVDAIKVPEGTDYRAFLVAGIAVTVGLSCIGPTAMSVAVDRKSGLVVRTRTMPVFGPMGLVAQVMADLVAAAAALGLVTIIGFIIGWRPHGTALEMLLSYLLLFAFYSATIWVGVLIGLILGDPETIEPVGAMIVVVFSFLSNAFLSPETMPSAIRAIAEWNPVSAVVTTCRDLWGIPTATSSTSFAATHPQLIAVGTVAVVFVVAAVASARVDAKASR